MPLSTKVLVAEADRLVARAERQLSATEPLNDMSEFARRAELDLKRSTSIERCLPAPTRRTR